MVQVPTAVGRLGQVQTSPLSRARLRDTSSGADREFAAESSRLGRAIENVGLEWQRKYDETAAREAETALSNEYRRILFLFDPDEGYLFTKGQNAIDRLDDARAALEKAYAPAADGLSPEARDMIRSAASHRMTQALRQISMHAVDQRDRWMTSASEARRESARQDALAGWRDPALVQSRIKLGVGELEDQAEREGWAPERLALAKDAYRSEVQTGIIGRIAITDPLAAQSYLDQHRDQILPEDATTIEAGLSDSVVRARARDAVDTAMQVSGAAADVERFRSAGNWYAMADAMM